MELMIFMVAVLCFLDALWSYAFTVSSKPARASSTSKYTFIKSGPGRSRSLWCCFSSSSSQRKARSLHCSDTGHLCVSLACCLHLWHSGLQESCRQKSPCSTVTAGHVQGVCQCCWKMLLELPQSGSCFITPVNSSRVSTSSSDV